MLARAIPLLLIAASASAQTQTAPQPAAPPEQARARAVEDLVIANRILADLGVLDGYGHVSIRVPGDAKHFLLARSVAPELVTASDILEHDLEGNASAPPGTQLFGERFIHAAVYAARSDVQAVVHNHAPSLIPFGVTSVPLRPMYHMSAFLADGVPVFDIRTAGGETDMLVKTLPLGQALAKTLGAHNVVLMRGHGAVVVAADIQRAVFRSVYSELNARLQAQAMQLSSKVTYLDPEEAKKAQATMEATVARPWDLWRRKVQAKPEGGK
ncbi:MAG TPA: class II aldolase/adducin family protein [Myxococcales bacterium]|jgi:HCOMODA/2-hydroxy-3-carboxy-muconic semialdehyde decarboxylase|nr:class II aldolase/adducin family protein [Myxococcales bacterium]